MYTAFNLQINLEDFPNVEEYIRLGKQRKEDLNHLAIKELNDFLLSEEILDGKKLSNSWFKTIESDVFISHSHNDTNLAYALAGWLKKEFDLEVFLDEVVWGNADTLLKKIDEKYCKQENSKNYDYNKRNFSTSHVHAMLSTAIHSVMDNAEAIFFLNTNESFPPIKDVLNEDSTYTLSPWIYQETINAKLLRITKWEEYRKRKGLRHSANESFSNKLNIAYKTPLSEFTIANKDALFLWQKKYSDFLKTPYAKLFSLDYNHPLNYLYEIVFEKK